MTPACDWHVLKRAKASELLTRFAFGGAVSVAAALAGSRWGPSVGGLFLAFPAILPASLVLVKEKDGRDAADDDAKGAQLGALGLVVFAFTVTCTYRAPAWLALSAGSLAWLVTSLALWWLRYGGATARQM